MLLVMIGQENELLFLYQSQTFDILFGILLFCISYVKQTGYVKV